MIVFQATGVQKNAFPQPEIVIYPTIKYNDGSGYNNSTGKFTAPMAGLYAFAKLTCSYVNDAAITAFMHNGHSVLVSQVSATSSSSQCTSAELFVKMSKGDQMWVQTVWSGTNIVFDTVYHETSFTGAFIHG